MPYPLNLPSLPKVPDSSFGVSPPPKTSIAVSMEKDRPTDTYDKHKAVVEANKFRSKLTPMLETKKLKSEAAAGNNNQPIHEPSAVRPDQKDPSWISAARKFMRENRSQLECPEGTSIPSNCTRTLYLDTSNESHSSYDINIVLEKEEGGKEICYLADREGQIQFLQGHKVALKPIDGHLEEVTIGSQTGGATSNHYPGNDGFIYFYEDGLYPDFDGNIRTTCAPGWYRLDDGPTYSTFMGIGIPEAIIHFFN